MTKLVKSVTRETRAVVSGRPVVVELRPPDMIVLKLKGTRKRLVLSVLGAFHTAAKIEALAIMREKAAERKARKLARRKGI